MVEYPGKRSIWNSLIIMEVDIIVRVSKNIDHSYLTSDLREDMGENLGLVSMPPIEEHILLIYMCRLHMASEWPGSS